MAAYTQNRTRLVYLLIPLTLIVLTAFVIASAAAQEPIDQGVWNLGTAEQSGPTGSLLSAGLDVPSWAGSRSDPPAPQPQAAATTTLEVVILSSPWATLDHNNPTGTGEEVPNVFVVEAVITNTGTATATDLFVTLDYNEDPINNWILVTGEDPNRTLDDLPAGQAYHAYWFTRYSTTIGASHQYTVSAQAGNAFLVATSDNSYGNPETGKTVKTRSAMSTGNAGVTSRGDVIVGVASTVTVEYDLGTNPLEVTFSPVGNPDFDPSVYRLLASQVRFYNDAGTQEGPVTDRLYFPTLPPFADNAQATFTFIASKLASTRLCSYAAVGYQSNDKYDQFYCRDDKDTIVPVTGTLTLSMTKQASSPTIQQNQALTYTIHYTNNGDLPLAYVWIWDEVDTGIGSIITNSIDPPSDPDATSPSQVAWYVGDVAAWGQPGSTGTLTFTIFVDGDGQDLIDDTSVVNRALFGVSQGSLPPKPALSSTVTTTVQVPVVTISKTDGQETAEPGDALTYVLRITNSGSVMATGLIITDQLPAEVDYAAGAANPVETGGTGATLVWDNLGPIPPRGGSLVITIPVSISLKVTNGTVLTNSMKLSYQNPAGWIFDTRVATDTTVVNAPVLAISKRDAPDPVLAGRSITYTLSYTNAGSAAATGVVITDAVPMSTTYQTCSGGSVCGVVGDVISWTLGTVPSQTSGTVSFSVRVSDTLATGTLIRNEEYGIVAEQTDPVSGPSVTTLVNRDAGLFEGYTYIDANGDGVYEPGSEDTLTGVTITLTSATVPITTTDSDGYYRFRVESTGAISVTAALPDGYFRTTPRAVYTDSVFGITQTVNFGYAPATSGFGVIYGTVFEDANHDAVRDLGEKGLVGVTVESSEAMTPSVTTNAYGQYALRYDVSGGVTITESNLNLYVSTTPDVVHTGAVIGSSGPSPVDFGDFYGLKITGRVFDDVNVNGINDAEEGISGATVTAASESLTTASTGVYTLYVVVSDNLPILISETDPAGYISTNAVPGGGMSRVDANTLRIDSPVSGGTYTSADFGDVLASSVITISGQVWDDNGEGEGGLANGLRDGAEPGLAGSVVRVSSGLTQTTAADGLFRLYAPPGQPITITEANPPGYLSTNAIPGDDASKLDDDTLVVVAPGSGSTSADNLFGDVSTSSLAVITGTVFDDANENGVLDGSESGLASITVTLEANGGGSIPVLTDASGNYQFAVVPGTDVRITSTRPEGSYYPTTLESVVLSPLEPGLFADNNFGYSDDSDVAVIMGVVFDDVNSDGEQGIGELGLSGAVITLDGASPVTTTVNGLITGTFTYSVTRDGVYALHEKNPSGYRSTTPDDIQVQANLGNSYAVAFGDTNSLNTASIHGIAFDDVNGNGLQDPTETGLPGVIISVTINADPGVLTTTTGAYGQFHYGFGVSEVGYHTVAEQDPAKPSYRSTTPDEVTLEVLMGNSYSVSFGDTTTATFSSIMGVVFDDWNGDGAQDLTEPGISGVLISLSEGISTTTNSYGGYTLPVTTTGPVRVMETDPVGYHSTTPNTVTVKLASLGKVYVVGFGDSSNRTVSSIFGTVFEDENIDGAWDLAEIPLSGVPVAIASASNGVLGPTMTNNWGQFTFLIEVTDVYTLTESDLPGYLSTNAIPGNPAVTKVDNHTLRTVVKTLGTDLGENLFGDVLESRVNPDILMRKEANTSTSEVGEIITYTYSVTNTGNTSLDLVNASDDRLGPVLLGSMSLRPGASTSGTLAYTVAEGDLPGPIVNTATVTGTSLVGRDVTDSDAVSVSLSNFSTISGRVFEDIDGDGEQDAGEAGIPDVLITLDGATTTTTGSNGDYAFFTAAAGFHIVVETDPEGYFSTTPNQVYIEVSLGNSYEVDFGDAPETSEFATLYGTVFEDIDGDGEWDVSEVGLKGVAITLGGAMGTTTDEDGGYSFHLTEGGVYTVVETDPEGYSSSTPNEVQVEVNLGNSYRVDFGDTLVSVCTCPADGYEEDDLVVQATELRVGERQMHDFCDDASDWSYFSAQAGQVYTITTSSWGQRADTFLALFDTDGQSLLASSDDYQGTTDYSSRVRWQAPESGMYYVRTRNRAALSGCLTDYEVWIEQRDRLHVYLPLVMRNLNEAQALGQALEAYPTGVIDHACPDNHEVDDTWEQAQLLEPNMWQVHSFDSDPEYYAADKDFVWFDVQARQTITFSVAELTHTVTLLELYDEHGVPLNVTGTTQLVWRADTAGRYHLSASPQTAAYGCADEVGYRLSMEMSPLRAVYLPLVLRSFTVP